MAELLVATIHGLLLVAILVSANLCSALSLNEAESLLERRQFFQLTQQLDGGKEAELEQSARWFAIRGQAFLQRMRYPRAYADFRRAYELDQTAEVLYWYGAATFGGFNGERNHEKGLELLKLASSKGSGAASHMLASILYPTDQKQAVSLLHKAATEGEVLAALSLAQMYKFGNGLPRSPEKSLTHHLAAANLGSEKAEHEVAMAYLFGAGTEQQEDLGRKWLQRAVNNGSADALYFRGAEASKTGNLSEMVKFYFRAAELNHTPATINLAVCYLHGVGVNQDVGQALDLFTNAGRVPLALMYLGDIYEHGIGVDKDPHRAFKYFEQASLMVAAKIRVAMYLQHGYGTSVDIERSEALYAEIAAQNNPRDFAAAAVVLATHQNSDLRDSDKALAWSLRAIQLNESLATLKALAASYAANALFDEAIDAQLKAISIFEESGSVGSFDSIESESLSENLASLQTGKPLVDKFKIRPPGKVPEASKTHVATFIGEVVAVFSRNGRSPRGMNMGRHENFELRIVIQDIKSGSLPKTVREAIVYYIHSPTMFFSRLSKQIVPLSAPEGLFEFELYETKLNGWAYDLQIKDLPKD